MLNNDDDILDMLARSLADNIQEFFVSFILNRCLKCRESLGLCKLRRRGRMRKRKKKLQHSKIKKHTYCILPINKIYTDFLRQSFEYHLFNYTFLEGVYNTFHDLLSKNNIGKIPCQYLDKEFLISLFCKSRKYSRNRLKHMCCLLTFERKHRPYFIQRLLFHLKKYVFAYSPNYDNWISDYVHATYKT